MARDYGQTRENSKGHSYSTDIPVARFLSYSDTSDYIFSI